MARGLIVALACSALLAGCINGTTGVKPENVTKANGTTVVPTQLPDNRSGTMIAYTENVSTDTMGMHSHDYWNGRTRVTLFQQHAMLGPAQNPAFPDAYGTQVVIRPPPGNIVYEGTDHIEITISNPRLHVCDPTGDWYGNEPICTDSLFVAEGPASATAPAGVAAPDPSPPSSLHLSFLTAADNIGQWVDGGTIGWNTATNIPIKDPKEVDMPHSVGSLWMFRISSSNPQDSMLEFDVKAVLVRGTGEIPLWPGHPLFYAKTHYRLVYTGNGESQDNTDTHNGGPAKTNYPDKLISAGTNTVLVFVNITSLNAPIPTQAPTGSVRSWFLVYHNASYTHWNLSINPNDTVDKKSLVWVLHSDANGMDSPYATQSRWAFWVRGADSQGCWGGCTTYDVKYTMTIIATDLPAGHYDSSFDGGTPMDN